MTGQHLPAAPANPPERIPGPDLLRGLAVVLMVQQHVMAWLWDAHWVDLKALFHRHPFIMGLNALGGMAAPLFLFCAGFGAQYEVLREKGRMRAVRRGLALVALGFALNLLAPFWFNLPSWYVLHCIGLCVVLSPALDKLSTGRLAVSLPLIVVATWGIHVQLATPLGYASDRMNDITSFGDWVKAMLARGHFPLLPWLFFFVAGMLCARWRTENRTREPLTLGVALLAMGLLLTAAPRAGLPTGAVHPAGRLFTLTSVIYPLLPPLLMYLSAATVLLYLVIEPLAPHLPTPLYTVTVALGRSSLTVFFVHILLFKQICHMAGLFKMFSAPAASAVTAVALALFAALSVVWGRHRYRYGIEWFVGMVCRRKSAATLHGFLRKTGAIS